MSKNNYPVTPSIRFLRAHTIDFEPKMFVYMEHGGAAHSAQQLGVPEHAVIKTIVLQNERKEGVLVLMHGDKEVSTRNLARQLGMKHLELADEKQANKWTGFLFGGTSPFGTKTTLPVMVEKTIWDLDMIYINGGKRGFLVAIRPEALRVLNPKTVEAAA
ncbi:membrane protein [Neisseria arctica]|uniref:Cys-tRNA(Pro)/Cys-tRNA(Cys) deacylase n=1 Tax=Neisseria arctica TaxID=1470200 RepID=A0A0J0YTW5_9NEIS|nr:YbaK/EbsC family protein [Neisseria arctica]KLT73545.1 membrane protein [Neisseria arctica]UOO86215.1 Cys-tRNA(Pro) deacylase [Neisseria arctica]